MVSIESEKFKLPLKLKDIKIVFTKGIFVKTIYISM